MMPVHVPTLEKLSSWHQFTRLLKNGTFIVSRIVTQSSWRSFSPAFCMHLIKCILLSITFLCVCCCFPSLFVSFSLHAFCGLARACVNPTSFSLFVQSLACQTTHSFLNEFHSNLCHHFSHACSIYHTMK